MGTTNWQTHGMIEDDEMVLESAEALGMMPEEAEELAKLSEFNRGLHLELAKHHLTPEPEKQAKHREVAEYHQRRARRWTELAAELEKVLTESPEYKAAMEDDS
jgi:hypothetical protein